MCLIHKSFKIKYKNLTYRIEPFRCESTDKVDLVALVQQMEYDGKIGGSMLSRMISEKKVAVDEVLILFTHIAKFIFWLSKLIMTTNIHVSLV